MPATALNTLKARNFYNREKQKSLFQLWLMLTAIPEVVQDDTTICYTQKDVSKFVAANTGPDNPLYLDVPALTRKLKPLPIEAVSNVLGLLKDPKTRKLFQIVADHFQDQGVACLRYGPGGCTSVGRIISLKAAGPDPDK